MSNCELILKGLQEVVGEDVLTKIAEKRPVKVYWGTAPTGRIHIGYYIPMLKIAELVAAGCEVTILIADLHAMLDNLETNERKIQNRSTYYIKVLKTMLNWLNVPEEKVKFVLGSSFQTIPDYSKDVLKINSMCTFHDAQHAGAEVVKGTDNPKMSGLLYPSLQALDEEYLKVDAQLGGVDQRKIFMFAREFLPKLGYKKRCHLMLPMVQGLRTAKRDGAETVETEINHKMSASNQKTKLDLLDTRAEIKKKINAAYCLPGNIDDNSVIDILGSVLFPLLRQVKKDFVIFRKEEHGGPIIYSNIETVTADYASEKLHPGDLKAGVIDALDQFIEPVRKEFETRELRQILKHAYD